MNEEELKRWERHIGKAQEYEFEDNEGNKDKFLLVPLPLEFIGDLLFVSDTMNEMAVKGSSSRFDESIKRAEKIILETLKLSYPEIPEETLKGFAKKHFVKLIGAILELNHLISKTSKVDERLAQIRRNIAKTEKKE